MKFQKKVHLASGAFVFLVAAGLTQITLTGQVGNATTGIVMDDSDPTFARGSFLSAPSTTAYRRSLSYAKLPTVRDTDRVTWTFANLTAGSYEIFATWPAIGSAANSAVYIVSSVTNGAVQQVATFTVNQALPPIPGVQQEGVFWQSGAKVTLSTNAFVRISLPAVVGKLTIADAVMIRPVVSSSRSSSMSSSFSMIPDYFCNGTWSPVPCSSSSSRMTSSSSSTSVNQCAGNTCAEVGNQLCITLGLVCENIRTMPCIRCVAASSSRNFSSSVSSVACPGDVCASGGNMLCEASGKTCRTTSNSPCMECIITSTSSRGISSSDYRSSAVSSFTYWSSAGSLAQTPAANNNAQCPADACATRGGNQICGNTGRTCKNLTTSPCMRCIQAGR